MSNFPFDDVERLEREEDALPPIPEWPSIISYEPKRKKRKDTSRD